MLLASGVSCTVPEEPKADSISITEVSDSLTFWGDAAPIIFKHCTPCHHKDGAGPFPLTDFKDLASRIKTIRLAIADNYMPPWPADPSYRHFKGEKVLSPIEKTILLSWIDQGAVEGKKTENEIIPITYSDLELGEPDLIIPLPETVGIPGNARDFFAVARVNFELKKDTILKAIAFVPGNRQLVHHVNAHLINYEPGKKTKYGGGTWLLDAEKTSSMSAYRQLNLANDDGTYPPMLISAFNYLPGVEPASYPDGLGTTYIAKNGAFLLNTLHFGPSPIDTTDRSEIHLFFADRAPERPLRELQMGTLGVTTVVPEFVIHADSVSIFTTSYNVPAAMSVLTINPHMHLLGKTFQAWASSPDGKDTIPLILIPDWDFRWQYFYTFPTIQVIPAGYTITAKASFDNTVHNPFNPNIPPITMRSGGEHMKTTDEMFQFFLTFVDYRTGDENIEL